MSGLGLAGPLIGTAFGLAALGVALQFVHEETHHEFTGNKKRKGVAHSTVFDDGLFANPYGGGGSKKMKGKRKSQENDIWNGDWGW